MKIENEIEKLSKRVTLIETQNSRFKYLLDSALQVTKQSLCETNLQTDENEFLQETIRLIEDEKLRMQEELDLLSSSGTEGVFYFIKHLENDNLELRKKVELLLNQLQKSMKEIDQLKIEHTEFKFLLSQPNSNTEWLKNIINLDSHMISGGEGAHLLEERLKLQRKVTNFEQKKLDLITALENMDIDKSKDSPRKASLKANLENILFTTIDDDAKKRYHDLQIKLLKLEKTRSQLLSDLQNVLDESRKALADEYSELQKKILEIESKKATEKKKVKCMKEKERIGNKLKERVAADDEEKLVIDTILNAFSNRMVNGIAHKLRRSGRSIRNNPYPNFGLPTCSIL